MSCYNEMQKNHLVTYQEGICMSRHCKGMQVETSIIHKRHLTEKRVFSLPVFWLQVHASDGIHSANRVLVSASSESISFQLERGCPDLSLSVVFVQSSPLLPNPIYFLLFAPNSIYNSMHAAFAILNLFSKRKRISFLFLDSKNLNWFIKYVFEILHSKIQFYLL